MNFWAEVQILVVGGVAAVVELGVRLRLEMVFGGEIERGAVRLENGCGLLELRLAAVRGPSRAAALPRLPRTHSI